MIELLRLPNTRSQSVLNNPSVTISPLLESLLVNSNTPREVMENIVKCMVPSTRVKETINTMTDQFNSRLPMLHRMPSLSNFLDPGMLAGITNISSSVGVQDGVEHLTFTTPCGGASMTIISEHFTLSPNGLKIEEVEI